MDGMQTPVLDGQAAIADAIVKVMGSVGYIQKKGTNTFHNYKFTAIADVMEKLQPALVEAGLIIIQSQMQLDMLDNGAVVAIEYEFTLSHKCGAIWPEKPRHTGMTSCRNSKGGFDDKAANKCHTAARKYFLMALFQIPTGDHVDPDAEEDKSKPAGNGQPTPKPGATVPRHKPMTEPIVAKNATQWATLMQAEIAAAESMAELDNLIQMNRGTWDQLGDDLPKAKADLQSQLMERTAEMSKLPSRDIDAPGTILSGG